MITSKFALVKSGYLVEEGFGLEILVYTLKVTTEWSQVDANGGITSQQSRLDLAEKLLSNRSSKLPLICVATSIQYFGLGS